MATIHNAALLGVYFTPISSLPPLARLKTFHAAQISEVLNSLRALYFPPRSAGSLISSHISDGGSILPVIPPEGKPIPHLVHDDSVPDSGYASEDEVEAEAYNSPKNGERVVNTDIISEREPCLSVSSTEGDGDLVMLRSDPLERSFAIEWLTGLVKRSDAWAEAAGDAGGAEVEKETDLRSLVVDDAANILARFAGDDEEEEELTRKFTFPFCANTNKPHGNSEIITVELNDAPLDRTDHTSVGLQSWASSILLAKKMCYEPRKFLAPGDAVEGNSGIDTEYRNEEEKGLQTRRIHVLELGAGTGLLSIVTAKVLGRLYRNRNSAQTVKGEVKVVATDYHPDVIANLARNVQTNFSSSSHPVRITTLDWSRPITPEGSPFDVILAADVIYHPQHAYWIKACVEALLTKPDDNGGGNGGIFWMIIPLRSTGRHEGMGATVDDVFPDAFSTFCSSGDMGAYYLAIVQREEVERQEGVGRADEGGYKLFEIRWVKCLEGTID